MSNPLVSVIIPTFNRSTLISEAVRSVIDQDYSDYEIIVVDDGSTDMTSQVIASFGSMVRYEYQKKRGASAARNRGIAVSKGKYIAFLDSDDLFLQGKLRIQADILNSNPDIGMVYAHALIMDEDGEMLPKKWGGDLSGEIYPHMLFMHNCFITTPTVMARTEVIREVGGFDEEMSVCEDLDLWRRIARLYQVNHVQHPLAKIREKCSSEFDAETLISARTRYYEKAFAEDSGLEALLRVPLFSEMYYCYGLAAYNAGKIAEACLLLRRAVYYEPFRTRNLSLLLRYYFKKLLFKSVRP